MCEHTVVNLSHYFCGNCKSIRLDWTIHSLCSPRNGESIFMHASELISKQPGPSNNGDPYEDVDVQRRLFPSHNQK